MFERGKKYNGASKREKLYWYSCAAIFFFFSSDECGGWERNEKKLFLAIILSSVRWTSAQGFKSTPLFQPLGEDSKFVAKREIKRALLLPHIFLSLLPLPDRNVVHREKDRDRQKKKKLYIQTEFSTPDIYVRVRRGQAVNLTR